MVAILSFLEHAQITTIYFSSMVKEWLGHSAKCLFLYFIEERKLYDPYNGFRIYNVTRSVFHPNGEPF